MRKLILMIALLVLVVYGAEVRAMNEECDDPVWNEYGQLGRTCKIRLGTTSYGTQHHLWLHNDTGGWIELNWIDAPSFGGEMGKFAEYGVYRNFAGYPGQDWPGSGEIGFIAKMPAENAFWPLRWEGYNTSVEIAPEDTIKILGTNDG